MGKEKNQVMDGCVRSVPKGSKVVCLRLNGSRLHISPACLPRCHTGQSGSHFVRLWLAAENRTIRGVVSHSKRRKLGGEIETAPGPRSGLVLVCLVIAQGWSRWLKHQLREDVGYSGDGLWA